MFKLIALAMHFSPYFQGPVDPIVMEMIKKESARTTLKTVSETNGSVAKNVVNLEKTEPTTETRKAA